MQNLDMSKPMFDVDASIVVNTLTYVRNLSALGKNDDICPVNLRNRYTGEIMIADTLGKIDTVLKTRRKRMIESKACHLREGDSWKIRGVLTRMDEYREQRQAAW